MIGPGFSPPIAVIKMSETSGAQAQAQAKDPANRDPANRDPANQTRRSPVSRDLRLPGEDLSLEEMLRVMDVARELRNRRETAEEMFRRDDLRSQLREKLLRTARLSGNDVTEAEIDAAIGQYFESIHTYQQPEGGLKRFLAHCWVWRGRLMAGAAAVAVVAGSFWFLFA